MKEYELSERARTILRVKYRRKKLVAIRVTGSPGMGGLWQGYERMKGGGLNSVGDQVHMTSDGIASRV